MDTHRKGNGQYTITSAYEHIRHREDVVNWNNSVWLPKAIPRQHFMLWLAIKDSLKTRVMLKHRGMEIDDSCVLYNGASESVHHLFFECGICQCLETSFANDGYLKRTKRMEPTTAMVYKDIIKGERQEKQ